MRVLIATPSSDARLHHVVPMAWALRSGGHEVQLAGRPRFGETINRTGMVAVAIGADGSGDAEWLADGPAVDALAAHATRWRPDVVIWDQQAPAGAVAARVAGALSVRMPRLVDRLRPATMDGPDDPELAASLTRYGLTPHQIRPDTTLDPTPPSLRTTADAADRPIRHVPYHGPAIVAPWLRRVPRRSRIYAGPGATGSGWGELFEAVDGLDVEVVCVVAARRVPAGVRVPRNVRLLDAAPLQALLPTCSAIVHDGTLIADALALGLPHLVPAGETGPELGKQILALTTDPARRERAERLRDEVRSMPSPRDLVPVLAGLAGAPGWRAV
jgi:glycosyltransferase DesVII